MQALKPLPLDVRLKEDVTKFVNSIVRTDEYDHGRLNSLLADCETLAKTNAILASVQRAHLYSAIGEFEQNEKWLRNVELNRAHDEANIARLAHSVNHAFASQALALADKVLANPAGRNLMMLIEGVVSVGGVNKALAAVDASVKNNMVLKNSENIGFIRVASSVLTTLNVSDEHLSKMLDVAGEIMRAHRLFWQGNVPQIRSLTASNSDFAFMFDYRIGVTPKEAADLTWKLTTELVKRGLEREGVSLGFLGSAVPDLKAA